MGKKLTLKELGTLQETASQGLNAGKPKAELVAGMVAEGIDELTAQRIVDTADQRLKRETDDGSDAGYTRRTAFNYSTVTGALFLTAGVGAIGYVQVTGNGTSQTYAVASVAIMLGLYRLARGIIR